ncbi:acetylcholinesterase-like [Physella acuta]|uniref:acetylcholinesterase-like n=1 Tax=Physella acuta TaxID=109671 RepID=UPI0027DBB8CE|nr:acetylcholinesterase-like [Physella acuta]
MQALEKLLVVMVTLLVSVSSTHVRTSPVTMATTNGDVIGIRKVICEQTVDVFYGIPFAKPPLGELRFKAPVASDQWECPRNCSVKPNSCWQMVDEVFGNFSGADMWNPNTPMSEDCLYLNVWRPACTANCDSSKKKPIMVWIFGGSFTTGTTTLDVYDGTELAIKNDVVVVSIAYRLGPLGFIYLGTEDAPGNVGLLDQVMALNWVKDNAENLGGSADAITIFGESAGAVSVGFHLLSPLSRDLFKYAIMESASPLADWGTIDTSRAVDRANQLADIVNCPNNTPEARITCLRQANPADLTNNQYLNNSIVDFFDLPFPPVVDKHFLPDTPENLISRGEIKNTSVLVGVNKNEGLYFVVYAFLSYFPLNGTGSLSESQYDEVISYIFTPNVSSSAAFSQLYPVSSAEDRIKVIDSATGDKLFKCPVVDFAEAYAGLGGRVYMYSFEHRISTNAWPEWLGVAHGYEIEVVFGLPLALNSSYTNDEKNLSLNVMGLLTNFARTGNPNKAEETIWPEYNTETESYVIINKDGVNVDYKLRRQQCDFLKTLG